MDSLFYNQILTFKKEAEYHMTTTQDETRDPQIIITYIKHVRLEPKYLKTPMPRLLLPKLHQ